MSRRGLAHGDKGTARLQAAVTMTCGTAAHRQPTYLTFISVREVDRCSGSYGSSLSCSLHGAHSAAVDVSFIRGVGSRGRWRQQADQLWMISAEPGGHRRDSPSVCGVQRGSGRAAGCSCRRRAGAEPGAEEDGGDPELLSCLQQTCPTSLSVCDRSPAAARKPSTIMYLHCFYLA